jgi:hypothetical protein
VRAIVAVMVIVPGLLALQAAVSPAAGAATGPTITGVSPASGPISGDTFVTITGTNFLQVTAVTFGSTPAIGFTSGGPSSIDAVSPGGLAGTVDIRVTAGGVTTDITPDDHFTYFEPVSVTGVSPNSGPVAGGTTVTISGLGFTGATQVLFGSTPAPGVIVNSAASITATAPPGTAGVVDVRVVTPFTESSTGTLDQYTYVGAPPTVTSVSPNSGPAGGGTVVIITGAGFTGATSVHFGAALAPNVVVQTPTTISATAPPGTGTVDVTVTTLAGTSGAVAADRYTYQPAAGACTTTVTGTHAAQLAVTSGLTCLVNATQNGQVTVAPGAALSVTNSTVLGTVTATSPSGISYCGSTEHGALTVTGATGPVTLGGVSNGSACAADNIPSAVTITGASAPVTVNGLTESGTLTLENDTGAVTFADSHVNGLVFVENNAAPAPAQVTVSANTVTGSLTCTGNDPARPTTASSTP